MESNPRIDALEAFLPSASKEMGRKGMTSHKQWERYRAAHPDGYSLTQFRVALRRYDRIVHHSLRVELFGESIRKRKSKSENAYG